MKWVDCALLKLLAERLFPRVSNHGCAYLPDLLPTGLPPDFLDWQLQRDSLAPLIPSEFLDLRVRVVDQDGESADDLQALAEDANQLKEARFSIRALALLKKPNRRILLTGISGAGKTVALGSLTHRLTSTATAALNQGIDPDFVPLWTPASEFPEVDFNRPVDWLAGRLQDGGVYTESDRLAESLFGSGRLVLLIDSLHEVVGISHARTVTLMRLARLPNVRILASARPGYDLPGAEYLCDVLSLEGLNSAERDRILVSRRLSTANRDQLHRLAVEPRLRRAVEVPQIWQMAVELAKGGTDLSNVTQEVTLYERFFDEAFKARQLAESNSYLTEDVESLLEMFGGHVHLPRWP